MEAYTADDLIRCLSSWHQKVLSQAFRVTWTQLSRHHRTRPIPFQPRPPGWETLFHLVGTPYTSTRDVTPAAREFHGRLSSAQHTCATAERIRRKKPCHRAPWLPDVLAYPECLHNILTDSTVDQYPEVRRWAITGGVSVRQICGPVYSYYFISERYYRN